MFCLTSHLSGGPELRNHTAVAVEHKVYCFTKWCKGQIDVNVFNTVSLRWRTLRPVTPGRGERHLEAPSSRCHHTAVLIEDIIYICGGRHSHTKELGVLYAFDVDTHRWFKPRVSGSVPEGRENHSACVLGKVMFIYGGVKALTGRTNDIYKLDTTTMVWSLINTRGIPPRVPYYHSATIIGIKMFLVCVDNIRVFDTETDSWLNTSSAHLPERRWLHSAFAYNGQLYIFGCRTWNQTAASDLWKFNSETFSWKKVETKGKGPSNIYEMCCCMVGDRVILFDAYKPNDLYILDLSPSLKTLCKLAVIQYGVEQSELPHNIRWELAAMTTNSN